MDAIDRFLEQKGLSLPSLNSLPELLAALRHGESDFNRIVDLITFDPALTARVLMTSNSAFFARSEPVNDVAAAVSRLGFNNVYQIVAAVKAAGFFQALEPAFGLDAKQLWKHSVGAAFAAQFIAEDLRADTGLYFTAGLLHDLGKPVLALIFKQAYGAVVAQAQTQARPLVRVERAALAIDHAEAGARLLKRWRLSGELVAAVRYHHEPGAAGEAQRAAALAQLANELAHHLEENAPASAPGNSEAAPALTLLNLPPERLSHYRQRIRENIEFVQAMYRLGQ